MAVKAYHSSGWRLKSETLSSTAARLRVTTRASNTVNSTEGGRREGRGRERIEEKGRESEVITDVVYYFQLPARRII